MEKRPIFFDYASRNQETYMGCIAVQGDYLKNLEFFFNDRMSQLYLYVLCKNKDEIFLVHFWHPDLDGLSPQMFCPACLKFFNFSQATRGCSSQHEVLDVVPKVARMLLDDPVFPEYQRFAIRIGDMMRACNGREIVIVENVSGAIQRGLVRLTESRAPTSAKSSTLPYWVTSTMATTSTDNPFIHPSGLDVRGWRVLRV